MDVVQLWSMDATDVMRFKVCGARTMGRSQDGSEDGRERE